MKFYAVTGNPILHSKSPQIYNYWFHQDNIDAHYSRIAANTYDEALAIFKELRLHGMNITAPFKLDAYQNCDNINDLAEDIQSVNTIIDNELINDKLINDGHSIIGYNTDYLGFIDTINNLNVDLNNKKVLVIGAGNASKNILFALKDFDCSTTLINRSIDKAKALANQYKVEYASLDNINELVKECDVLINTLDSKFLQINEDCFDRQIIFDVTYHQSKLLEIAKAKDLQYISGLEWLLNQAVPAYKLYTNKQGIISQELRDEIQRERNIDRIYLIGFMGSGKSSIGRELSKKLNYDFIDIDEMIIEEEKGRTSSSSINEIFEKYGEQYFRKIETETLLKYSHCKNTIISCGGGIISQQENIDIIKRDSAVLWLYAPFDVCMDRLRNSADRPIINNSSPEQINALYENRKPVYFKTSDIIINTNTSFEKVLELASNEIIRIKQQRQSQAIQIEIPDSKSELQRAIAIAILNDSNDNDGNDNFHNNEDKQNTLINFNSLCDDTLSAIRLAWEIASIKISSTLYDYLLNCELALYSKSNRNFIQSIRDDKGIIDILPSQDEHYSISISKSSKAFPKELNAGESGLAFNLFSALAALQNTEVSITADGTLLNREQKTLRYVLESIGKTVISSNAINAQTSSKPPLLISGEIKRNSIILDTLESSQALSALLIIFSELNTDLSISAKKIKSINYAMMTMLALQKNGRKIRYSDGTFSFQKNSDVKRKCDTSEKIGCWSSASFWFVLAACSDYDISISNLDPNSIQADKAILEILELSGAVCEIIDSAYFISSKARHAFNYDCTNCPDLIPNLIIFASQLDGISKITGASRLINKESNRAKVILEEFTKLNIDVQCHEDTFFVHPSKIINQKINYHNDHRIEMAAALACLLSGEAFAPEMRDNTVGKSYPEFYEHIDKIKHKQKS